MNTSGASTITATLSRTERRPFGEHVFYLSNGEVWTELEAGRNRYQIGTAIRIEATPVGGHILSTESGGRATRVKRLE